MPKYNLKKLTLVSLAALTLLGQTAPALAQGTSKTPNLAKDVAQTTTVPAYELPANYPTELTNLTQDVRSYVVVDQATHNVLMAREATTPYPIASMSKILAMHLVYKAIEEGKVKEDDKVKATAEIVDNLTNNAELSSAGLVTDQEYTVKDLMYGIMLASGNDATTLLMQHIYGSEQEAVKAARTQLTEWGIENAEFYTTSGAPVKYFPENMRIEGATNDSQNKMSAADVALMAQYITEKYPQILDISSTREYTMLKDTPNEVSMVNNNLLLEGNEYGRPGVTGLKSGYTDEAGKCFVTISTENGHKIVAVVMGVQDPYSSYQETGILLDGLAKYQDVYNLAGLPNNKLATQAEKEAEAAKKAAEAAAQANTSNGEAAVENLPNRRESDFTNIMRSIFGIFN